MSNWRPNFNPNHLYFITTKAVDYTHLFRRDIVKRLLTDTLDCMYLRGLFTLYAFVIMPNHIHLIIQCPADNPVKDMIRDYKRHTADRLIRHYRAEDNAKVLNFLSEKSRSSGQKYKVWEDGYNAKNVFSPEFLRQKTEYIHNNPCQPHWNLVSSPKTYMWSSAKFYLTDQPAIIPVKDLRKLMV
jgi:REP element-mobilizing transposase RayT